MEPWLAARLRHVAATRLLGWGFVLVGAGWAVLIPVQGIALVFVGIAAFLVGIAAFFAVLFTVRWQEGMRTFLVGVIRWSTRVSAYFYLMTDAYPPFSIEP